MNIFLLQGRQKSDEMNFFPKSILLSMIDIPCIHHLFQTKVVVDPILLRLISALKD